MSSHYLDRPTASLEHVDSSLDLPYGVTAPAIVEAVNDVYAYLHALNRGSVDRGYGRLEELIQPPANFSGLLSNVFVQAVAKRTGNAKPGLAVNRHHNSRPDLVPRARYDGDAVPRGAEGIEVKASRSSNSYQGHNMGSGWLMVASICDRRQIGAGVRAGTDDRGCSHAREPGGDRLEISGRASGSRRTPTASVNRTGLRKLRAGTVYGLP